MFLRDEFNLTVDAILDLKRIFSEPEFDFPATAKSILKCNAFGPEFNRPASA